MSDQTSHSLASVRSTPTYKKAWESAWDIYDPDVIHIIDRDDLDGELRKAQESVEKARSSQTSGLSTPSSVRKLADAEAKLAAMEKAERGRRMKSKGK